MSDAAPTTYFDCQPPADVYMASHVRLLDRYVDELVKACPGARHLTVDTVSASYLELAAPDIITRLASLLDGGGWRERLLLDVVPESPMGLIFVRDGDGTAIGVLRLVNA